MYGFGHADIIRDFLRAVETDKQPAVTGCEGRKALELVLAIYHSAKFGIPVKLPLTEKFTIGLGLENE